MKRILSIFAVIMMVFTVTATSGVDIGVSFDENGLKDFHVAITSYYNVNGNDIEVAHKKEIPDEELPVLFFIAKHSGKDYNTIIKLRLGGKSWVEICNKYALSPSLFYVQLNNPAPPYGKAYGHYKNGKKKSPKIVSFSDSDIINFVNLKFISGHYGYDPNYIVEMRSKGRGFVEIQQTVKQKKNEKNNQANADKKKSKGHNKSKKK